MSAPTGADRARRRGLIALCATEITSWGVLYYAFPVLMGGIGADTGWSATTVMGGFSVGLAVSAVAGVPVGRLLDRWGPRPVMTAGSVLGVVSVAAIATAESPLWYIAAWALSGIAQAGVFYKPAFAAITGWYGPSRIRPLTALTLVAGLSSTVFAPLTAVLADRTDWRTTYLVLAVVLAVVTVPAHAVFLKVPWHPETRDPATGGGGGVMRSRPFVLLTVAMALATFGMFAATVNLVPLLTAHDASTGFAAWALGLCGAGQLLGRVGYGRFSAATGVRARTVTVLAAGGLTIAVTAFAAGPTIGLMAAVIVFGATRGTLTLLEATAVSDRWGTGGFGALYGAYSAPATVAMAMTPWVGAVLTDWIGGYRPLFLASAAIVLLAAVFAVWSVPATSRRDAGST
ncbi:MFS transporter [Stackebrandtia albiflava]|uniref:MFS transporter n=1 Tax=Stackebrandtia albiflava TaxID=406432 RepID=UPI001FCE5B82|nr:MFS transporter [Stackebrandtia albiflava]